MIAPKDWYANLSEEDRAAYDAASEDGVLTHELADKLARAVSLRVTADWYASEDDTSPIHLFPSPYLDYVRAKVAQRAAWRKLVVEGLDETHRKTLVAAAGRHAPLSSAMRDVLVAAGIGVSEWQFVDESREGVGEPTYSMHPDFRAFLLAEFG